MIPTSQSETEAYDPHAIVEKWVELWRLGGTFEADGLSCEPDGGAQRERNYVVSMFSYPSGDLHMGHAEVYSISDAVVRYFRMRGVNVLFPIGWDSFGLPAENAAFKRNLDPREWTYGNIEVQAESFRRLGISFDWRTRLHTSDPEYYRWNQWLFLRLREQGLVYRQSAAVNWCPNDQTVLANEQVIQGRCERCGTVVVQKPLTQWFVRTSAYAQRLLDDMAQLEGRWPDEILAMQRNWIGRSQGAYIDFAVDGEVESEGARQGEPVRVFTTRPDTVYGATFLVIAVDSGLAGRLCAPGQRALFEEYRETASTASEIERQSSTRAKTGVPLGRFAVNPLSGEKLPVYAADYVLAGYGTGAIMAVPAHDQRDLDFARAMGLPVLTVIDTGGEDPAVTGVATAGAGVLVNSGAFDGLGKAAAIAAVTGELAQRGTGEGAVTYRLRDWLISRQRYWGTPIPIVHCETCGEVPVPDDQLPVRLPESGYQLRPEDGKAPLATCEAWVNAACPNCGAPSKRDTDTMDTFVDSSWYFLRYPNPGYPHGPFDPAGMERWLPVGTYIGGKEHATGHLMFARFLTKALFDAGMLPFTEPFARLTNQGQVIMEGKAMSKSLGNLVNLQEQIALYGPDAVRVTMLFAGPPEDDIDWADVSPTGAVKWLARVWRLAADLGSDPARPAADAADDADLRREVHRLISETTAAMDGSRLNVAIARMMQLTSVLRKAVDAAGSGACAEPVREGVEALVRMVSCFAPFTAEEAWERLGHKPSVSKAEWPQADRALLTARSVTCIVQVDGKLRDRIEVSPDISADDLLGRALASGKVREMLNGGQPAKTIVRPPKLVNVVLPHQPRI